MMEPRIVKEVRSPDGIILDKPGPRERQEAIDPETASTLQKMMVGVVEDVHPGAKIPNMKVAGKTGTAEVPPEKPNSWFIASAPAEDPEIAVAVIIENGGDGEDQALPVAREIMEFYLKSNGS